MLNRIPTPPTLENARSRSKGFSVVEMLVAVVLLSIALMANVPLLLLAVNQNEIARDQMASSNIAERELDQISRHAFDAGGGFSDRDGNCVKTICAPGIESCGNALNGTGGVDFSLPLTSGFSFTEIDPQGMHYDVRWNIHATPSNQLLVSVGVRAQRGIILAPPVNLRALVTR